MIFRTLCKAFLPHESGKTRAFARKHNPKKLFALKGSNLQLTFTTYLLNNDIRSVFWVSNWQMCATVQAWMLFRDETFVLSWFFSSTLQIKIGESQKLIDVDTFFGATTSHTLPMNSTSNRRTESGGIIQEPATYKICWKNLRYCHC